MISYRSKQRAISINVNGMIPIYEALFFALTYWDDSSKVWETSNEKSYEKKQTANTGWLIKTGPKTKFNNSRFYERIFDNNFAL